MRLRNFEVWITDDAGRKLQELGLESFKKSATCYIPSESGKTFAVHCKDRSVGNEAHHFSLAVKLDGRCAGASKCQPGGVHSRSGMRSARMDTVEPYQFAEVQTTEDELLPHVSLADLGKIEVTIQLLSSMCFAVPFTFLRLEAIGAINERSKMAATHCATLGPSEPVHDEYRGQFEAVPLNPDAKKPYATFTFLYRPAARLQAEGITQAHGPSWEIKMKAQVEAMRKTMAPRGIAQVWRVLQPQNQSIVGQNRARLGAGASALWGSTRPQLPPKSMAKLAAVPKRTVLPPAPAVVTGKRIKSEEENIEPEPRSWKRVKLEPQD